MKPAENYPIMKTHGLAIGYRNRLLFENLSLSLPSGKLVCFMGPNGSGKSSLIRTLAGLQSPINGRTQFLDPSGNSIEEDKSKHIALVLTDPVYAGSMTVEELVTFGRYPYLDWSIRLQEEDKRIIRNCLEQVNISNLANNRVSELSDGQLQMVMIARALAQQTPVIILDEPTAHLDLNNRVEIMHLLRRLSRDQGKAILLATHELDLALQTADLIWLTGNERNIITGLPEDLVLRGTFDEIFRFKGFDLKTGKVNQSPFRNKGIELRGDGFVYLWTKNALERNGFHLDETSALAIFIEELEGRFRWTTSTAAVCYSLEDLLDVLTAS